MVVIQGNSFPALKTLIGNLPVPHTMLTERVIERIVTGEAIKSVYRCPACGGSNIKLRKRLTPKYRCQDCGGPFGEPREIAQAVTTYRSDHAERWIDLAGALSGAALRELCDKPGSQLSIRALRWTDFIKAIESAGFGSPLGTPERQYRSIAGGHSQLTVRVRKGQAAFRDGLIANYGETCAFSGPCPAAALEAAHLYSYAQAGEHHDGGGLLLRRDLHRLFDLGLITVNPESETLELDDEIAAFPFYAELRGTPLHAALTTRQRSWISEHRRLHAPMLL